VDLEEEEVVVEVEVADLGVVVGKNQTLEEDVDP